MKKVSIIGIIILVSISPLFRGLYFKYETYAFMAALALLSIIYLFGKIMSNEPIHINKWFMILGLLLVAAAALSFIKAVNVRENLEYIMQYMQFLIAFLVLYDYFHDKKQQFISAIMLPVVLAGFVCSAVGLMALTSSINILDATVTGNRIGTTFQYANTASIYFAICFLFSMTLANASKSILLRSLFTGMGNIIIFALFLTGSRGGYIVGMAVMVLMLVIQPSGYRIKGIVNFICMLGPVFITLKGLNMSIAGHDSFAAVKWLVISFFLAAIISLIIFLLSTNILKGKSITMPKGSGFVFSAAFAAMLILAFIFRNRLVSLLPPILGSRLARLSFNDINVLYRLNFDRDALKLIAGNWLFGLGGGGWKALYQSVQDYFYTAVFVHNNYLQVFVESGILGFLSYVVLVVTGVFNSFYSWLKAADEALKIYAGGILCGLIAIASHSAFDFDLSYASMALLLWVMFAAAAVSMPVSPDAGDIRLPLFMMEWKVTAIRSSVEIIMIVVCSILFSMNALYLSGVYNGHIAQMFKQSNNFNAAVTYYEEAYRLDPGNPSYAFELTKMYNYFANISTDTGDKKLWLEKARSTGEKSVSENRYYPVYMNTLTQTYLASDMPLQALEYAEKLAVYQRYNSRVYELLAESYLAAAGYYEKNNDTRKAKELLEKCIEIDKNPYLLKSNINKPYKVMSKEELNSYKYSKKLLAYLKEATDYLKKLE